MTHPLASLPLSDEAHALAARCDLGAPLAQYRRRPWSRQDVVVEVLLLLAGGFFIFNPFGFSNSVLAGTLIGSAIGLLLRHLFYRRTRVLVCAAGLVWRSGRKQEVVRWEEVAELVYGPPMEPGGLSRSLKTSGHDNEPICTLRRTDGTELTCKMDRAETKRVGEAVARATEPYLLPRAMDTYQSGALVFFGALSVGQYGINTEQAFLPWSEYRGYLITEGALTIWQPGGEPWMRLPLRQVSNLLVLTDLLDAIWQGQYPQGGWRTA